MPPNTIITIAIVGLPLRFVYIHNELNLFTLPASLVMLLWGQHLVCVGTSGRPMHARCVVPPAGPLRAFFLHSICQSKLLPFPPKRKAKNRGNYNETRKNFRPFFFAIRSLLVIYFLFSSSGSSFRRFLLYYSFIRAGWCIKAPNQHLNPE